MHTSFFDSCVINHNGGYDGNIYISNQSDNISDAIGNKVTIKTTTKALISTYKTTLAFISLYKNTKSKPKTQIVTGKDEDSNKLCTITILSKDIESYIECVILDKIHEKLDGSSIKFDKMLQVAEILNIKV